MGKHCYLPPKYYGENYDPDEDDPDDPDYFYKECYLGPCFVIHKNEELQEACYEKAHYDDDTRNMPHGVEKNKVIKDFMVEKVREMMEDIFTPAYVKKSGTPKCVREVLSRWIGPTVNHYSQKEIDEMLETSDEEDSDEEIEFGSVAHQLKKFAAHKDEESRDD